MNAPPLTVGRCRRFRSDPIREGSLAAVSNSPDSAHDFLGRSGLPGPPVRGFLEPLHAAFSLPASAVSRGFVHDLRAFARQGC